VAERFEVLSALSADALEPLRECVELISEADRGVIQPGEKFEIVPGIIRPVTVSVMNLETVRNRASMRLPKDAM